MFDEYTYTPEAPQPRPIRAAKRKQKQKAPQKRPANPDDDSETEPETDPEDNDAYDPAADSEGEGADPEHEGSDNAAFEIPLNTFVECLNIFGTAGPSTGNITAAPTNHIGRGVGRGQGAGRGQRGGGGWRNAPREEDEGDEGGGGRGRGLDEFFGRTGEGKTGMRLSYAGSGYPLTLIMCVFSFLSLIKYCAVPYL